MTRQIPRPTADVTVTVRGRLPGADEYAVRKVEEALRKAPEQVHSARIKMTRHSDPAVERSIVAQVNVDMRGRPIRAQASGPTVTEAVDLMHDRLRTRLDRAARHWEARRGHEPHSDGWRHGQLPTQRPDHFPRPPEEREIVRHKAFTLAEVEAEEAAWEMESLDYFFHLFTDAGSGRERVVHRTDGEIAVLDESPRLDLVEATERLELSGEPFVFFHDPDLDRGCVLYHRYDGHYGLITPAM